MKIIIMNKRKLQVFGVAIMLMTIIFGVGNMVKGHLKEVSFMQNNIKSLKQYEGLNKNISYKLPSEWKTHMKTFSSTEIVYHNEFTSKNLEIHGFVQVWNNEVNLKEFLNNSKIIAEKQNKITNYKIKNTEVDENQGYLLRYIINSKGTDYIAHEYFIKYNKGFIRFSFFSKKENFKEDMNVLYDSIVKTLKLK